MRLIVFPFVGLLFLYLALLLTRVRHPTISLIVAVYNVEDFIDECASSLVNQSFKDLEIIFVNDGSSDGSLDILNRYASNDRRVKIISQRNKGLAGARQTGLTAARGKYIKFVDGDDYISLNCTEICYKHIIHSKADILYHGSNFEPSDRRIKKNQIIETQVFYEIVFNVWRGLFKRRFLEKNNINYIGIADIAEDRAFNLITIPKAKKIQIITDKLYYYRTNYDSLTHKIDPYKQVRDFSQNLVFVYNNWVRNGYFKKSEAMTEYLKFCARIFSDSPDKEKLIKVLNPEIFKSSEFINLSSNYKEIFTSIEEFSDILFPKD